MKKYNRLHLFWLLLIMFACSNNNIDCSRLPEHYSTFKEAVDVIESASFKIKEEISTSKSTWIREASYYSCDGRTGFLIVKTDNQKYISANVQLEIWEGFKNADSFGGYYNQYIKGRYYFNLNTK
jgi:hypothetical protein